MSILIVEDDSLIALDLAMSFEDAGLTVAGPAQNVRRALEIIDNDPPDCACLDYNLGRETSIPVAEALLERGIPFVFATGRLADICAEHDLPNARILSKPVDPSAILLALQA